MNELNCSRHLVSLPKSTNNQTRQEFWNGTLVDDYNFLMSEELIYHCKSSLGEPFCSLNDLAVHHVSYNEFEKQSIELSDWCEKSSQMIKQSSSNTLTCYLRQKFYEDLYEQGLMRLRTLNQYAEKLIERFSDLKIVIEEKREMINGIWNELEGHFIRYLDEDFDQIIEELYKELFVFEEWIVDIEEQLEQIQFLRNEKVLFEDCQQVMKLQNEIKSKNSCVSSITEICERLKNDYKQQIDQIPFDYVTDLENRWHQIWIYSLEIQCKLEERMKLFKHSTSCSVIDDDDIIPFNSSEYEKLSLTSSTSSEINQFNHRKRPRSPTIRSILTQLNRQMAKSKRRMSLNLLPNLSPSIFYYSLTNINDSDEQIPTKKQKKTSSKLDIGYASEDDFDQQPIYSLKKSQSDCLIHSQPISNILSTLTHSLPVFDHQPWWRHSTTSAYDTCSNPDMDLSLEETKQLSFKPSLLIYSKKYIKTKRISPIISNSYDASVEYTDADQSENDVDILASDVPISTSRTDQCLFYNRYATTTTTTGYSSDMELEQIQPEKFILSIENSEPCWDGYQNPLFYPLNSQDIDSIETTLKWDDQFLEMDQPSNSDDEEQQHLHENFNRFRRTYNSSSSSLITSVNYKQQQQQFDSDSDLEDFNYVIQETNRQLLKTRQNLDKKKRRQLTSILNDHHHHQRKYDEILRTCQTNIQCLQQILQTLHRSTHTRLHRTRAIELLQTYLFDWHDMQEQVNDERTRAQHFLDITQEIIEFKLRLDEEFLHLPSSCFDHHSLLDLQHHLSNQFKVDQNKLNQLHTDLHLVDEHLRDYRMTYPDGPSSLNIDEHLHRSHLTLEQLTAKMHSYQMQLQTLLNMIEHLLPIENHLEQKLTSSLDDPIDLPELQILVENYARMISRNDLLKSHCEYKLDIYRKILNDHLRKRVSFDGSINFNNNNSSTTLSSNSSTTTTTTPQPHLIYENTSINQFRQKREIRDIQQNFTTKESSHQQSSTSSYISDDCKVLYIETVIEVDKPVFYERTIDTSSSTNTEFHHHHQQHIPTARNQYLMDPPNNHQDSTDDELPSTPITLSSILHRSSVNGDHHSRQQNDSAIELDGTYSPSTFSNRERLLFPSTNQAFEETSEPTLLRRIQQQRANDNTYQGQVPPRTRIRLQPANIYRNPVRRNWFRALLMGLLILLIPFLIYLFSLDLCTRTTWLHSIRRAIIRIDSDGRPPI